VTCSVDVGVFAVAQSQEPLPQANSIQLELWTEALFDDASKLSDVFG
jgi:hypothetical protein